MKLWQRIFGTNDELARMDRRAFLRGMSVTAAGLIVPLPTIFIPTEEDRSVRALTKWVRFGSLGGISEEIGRRILEDAIVEGRVWVL